MIERRIDELLSTLQCDLSLTVDLTGVFDPGGSFHGLAPSETHVTLGFEQETYFNVGELQPGNL